MLPSAIHTHDSHVRKALKIKISQETMNTAWISSVVSEKIQGKYKNKFSITIETQDDFSFQHVLQNIIVWFTQILHEYMNKQKSQGFDNITEDEFSVSCAEYKQQLHQQQQAELEAALTQLAIKQVEELQSLREKHEHEKEKLVEELQAKHAAEN
jgi:hypothetical protein